MFENLIAQEDIVRSLSQDISKGELPPSMLFSGPENSGKLTAALETARILSCETDGAWNCPCPSCERHRGLSHPDVLLLGPRSLRAEILAASELLSRNPNRAARFLFLRAVRKLTLRFSPTLYEGEETRLAKAVSHLQTLDELAEAAGPGRDDPEEAKQASIKALPVADKLEALLPDSIPIFQIRAVERWIRLAPFGKRKLVVMDNSERMMEGARNALLKILEEPPATACFILLSSRPSALIPTVLSRVRSYPFHSRDSEASASVLAKVFRAEGPDAALSLDSFLAARKPLSSGESEAMALRFLSALCAQLAGEDVQLPPAFLDLAKKARDLRTSEALSAIFADSKGFGSGDDSLSYLFPAFLKSLGRILETILKGPQTDADAVDLLALWAAILRDALLRYESYNLSPSSLAERLSEAMAEAAGRRS